MMQKKSSLIQLQVFTRTLSRYTKNREELSFHIRIYFNYQYLQLVAKSNLRD